MIDNFEFRKHQQIAYFTSFLQFALEFKPPARRKVSWSKVLQFLTLHGRVYREVNRPDDRVCVCVGALRHHYSSLLEFFQDQFWHLLGFFMQEENRLSAKKKRKRKSKLNKKKMPNIAPAHSFARVGQLSTEKKLYFLKIALCDSGSIV